MSEFDKLVKKTQHEMMLCSLPRDLMLKYVRELEEENASLKKEIVSLLQDNNTCYDPSQI